MSFPEAVVSEHTERVIRGLSSTVNTTHRDAMSAAGNKEVEFVSSKYPDPKLALVQGMVRFSGAGADTF